MTTELADLLWSGIKTGRADVTNVTRPVSIADGLALQLALADRRVAEGDGIGGWKVGLTSGKARDSMGAGARPFGYVMQSRIFRSNEILPNTPATLPGIEQELAFHLVSRLEGPETDAVQARRAVGSVAVAFEINENRLVGKPSQGVQIADDLRQWGVVLGDQTKLDGADVDWESLESTMTHNGREVARLAARGHIDDHFETIAALARGLARFGRAVEPGAVVITGSYTRVDRIDRGRYQASMTGLGSVEIDVSPLLAS